MSLLTVAIILAAIGVLLLIVGPRVAAREGGTDVRYAVRLIGWVLVIAGVAFFILWAVREVDDGGGRGAVGLPALLLVGLAVDPGSRGAARASRLATGGRPRPVLLAFVVTAVPVVCAFLLQVLEAAGALDSALWVRTVLVGLGPLVGALAALWAQAQVTPLGDPRDEAARPLRAPQNAQTAGATETTYHREERE